MARGAGAWPRFLDEYSSFISGCIRRYTADYDDGMEIYVHVCARLRADDCRRLRQFRGLGANGPCRFTTWLAAVTVNLAREWIRTTRGRKRMFRSIRELSLRDRLVFQYRYWDGFAADEIAEFLTSHHGIQSDEAIVEASLRRIQERLGRRNLWRLATRKLRARVAVLAGADPRVDEHLPDSVAAAAADSGAAAERALEVLQRAIRRLPPKQRQALALRFAQGMSARAAADVLGIEQFKQVYDLQARGLASLRDDLEAHGVSIEDFGRNIDTGELLG